MKKELEEKQAKLDKSIAEHEEKKAADYDKLNKYKDEVYEKLKHKKDEVATEIDNLRESQKQLDDAKEAFEVTKKDELKSMKKNKRI